jgi:hypothetical protein
MHFAPLATLTTSGAVTTIFPLQAAAGTQSHPFITGGDNIIRQIRKNLLGDWFRRF